MNQPVKIVALGVVYNEEDYIEYSLRSIYLHVDEIVICLNTGLPWYGPKRESDKTLKLIEAFNDPEKKITLIKGEWPSEPAQRQAALDVVKGRASHCLIIDGDEIYDPAHLRNLIQIAALNPDIGQFAVGMNTYWKDPLHRIDPPEPYTPIVMSRVTERTAFIGLRETNEWPIVSVDRSHAILFHFSYAKTSSKIKEKIANFSHANEIIPGWFERVWLGWNNDPDMEDLHPTHPTCYKRAIRESRKYLPKVMWDHPMVLKKPS